MSSAKSFSSNNILTFSIKSAGDVFNRQSDESDRHSPNPDDEDEKEGRHGDLLLWVVSEDEDGGVHRELQGQGLVVKVVEEAA